jgi:hypothetical protein
MPFKLPSRLPFKWPAQLTFKLPFKVPFKVPARWPPEGPIPPAMVAWAVAAALALVGIGALTAKLVRGVQPVEPDPTEQPALPGDDVNDTDEPETDTPNAPSPPRHKHPAVPPKRKPTQRDKRHGR